jgi:hypothetical protein
LSILFVCVVDCKDLYDGGARINNIYNITVPGSGNRYVLCNMDAGGWTLIQARVNEDVHFNRSYDDYINGFGANLDQWIGLELIHLLTTRPNSTSSLRFDVMQSVYIDGTYAYPGYLNYANVWVDDRASGYKIHVTSSDSDISDLYDSPLCLESMRYNDGQPFSTVDHDVDGSDINCASEKGGGGGWWYNSTDTCSAIFINGVFEEDIDGPGLIFCDFLSSNNAMSVKRNGW